MSKYLFMMFITVLTGVLSMENQSAAIDVNKLNANPERLSNSTYRNEVIKGLDIRNATIRNMKFDTVNAEGAKFTNVTFENCTFINCRMRFCHFENIAFKNCTFEGRGDPQFLENITNFQYSTMIDILFENTRIHSAWFEDIRSEGGYVCFRNMHDFSPRGASTDSPGKRIGFGGGSLFSARKAHIRVVDSNLNDAVLYGGSVWVRNSTFKNSTLDGNYAYVENVSMDEGMMLGKILRVEKCNLTRVILSPLKVSYLLYNNYLPKKGNTAAGERQYLNSRLGGAEQSTAILLHNDMNEAYLDIGNGSQQLNNIKLVSPRSLGLMGTQTISRNLDMRNVTIIGEWDIDFYRILKGRWENVNIEGVIRLDEGNLENIEAYNLRYLQDKTQFKDATSSIKITQSPKPFQWETPKIPTPQEIGHKFWPDVDPGYHP